MLRIGERIEDHCLESSLKAKGQLGAVLIRGYSPDREPIPLSEVFIALWIDVLKIRLILQTTLTTYER